uniref:hypothetical protein n=1 Tax=Lactococcus petauri TaxID=1940789 RepID=UPI001F5994E7
RRISKARSRIAVPVDPSLKDQKVMGTSNPYAFQQQKDYSLDLGLQGSFAQRLHYFGTNKEDLNQIVYRYGTETTTFDSIKGFEYGYSIGVLGTSGDGKVRARRNLETPKIRRYCQAVKDFQDGVDSINAARTEMKRWVSGSILATILVIAQVVPGVNALVDFIAGVLGLGAGAGVLAHNAFVYIKASNKTYSSYNKL